MFTTDATVPWVTTISLRGKEALAEGEDVYESWTYPRIYQEIVSIKSNEELPQIDLDSLHQVHLDVLKDYLLHKSSWHHINDGEKIWFYSLNRNYIAQMTQYDVQDMIDETIARCSIVNCPRLVEVVTYQWVKSMDRQHDNVRYRYGYGVLYNNSVYFYNGVQYPLRHDRCEIIKRYGHIKSDKKRQIYNQIRKDMRKCGIYC